MFSDKEICHMIFELLHQRGAGKTICPSEVARALNSSDWRTLMEPVRRVAKELAAAEKIEITQKGNVLPLDEICGAVRLRLPQPK